MLIMPDALLPVLAEAMRSCEPTQTDWSHTDGPTTLDDSFEAAEEDAAHGAWEEAVYALAMVVHRHNGAPRHHFTDLCFLPTKVAE